MQVAQDVRGYVLSRLSVVVSRAKVSLPVARLTLLQLMARGNLPCDEVQSTRWMWYSALR